VDQQRARTVVVSGGGTGIGRAISASFADAGDTVVVVGRRLDVLEAFAAGRHNVVPVRADVTNPEDLRAVAAELERRFTTLDVVVANAGASHRGPLDTLEDVAEHWRRTVDANLLSAVLLEHAVRPLLRRPGGRFIAITSSSATSGGGEVAYASSKAALNRWIVQVANDVGAEGITANCVSPGFVPDTELYGGPVSDAASQQVTAGISVGRIGTPEDIAAAVRYVASDEAGFVSGTVLDVNGGRRAVPLAVVARSAD